jgi:hypothetical protein
MHFCVFIFSTVPDMEFGNSAIPVRPSEENAGPETDIAMSEEPVEEIVASHTKDMETSMSLILPDPRPG